MFNNLVSTLVNWMASGLDFAINWIIKMLGFNISFFTNNFPVVLTLYGILQGVGIALVIAIAIFQLYMFFSGPLSDKATTSSPLEILVRSIIAILLIFLGNYILEFIVNLFSYPYAKMMEIDATKIAGGEEDVMTNAAKIIAMYDPRANGGGFGVLLALIIIIVIGWNTIKLLLEVVERYLMVGVLTFTSPLAWSTVSSRSTHQIFSKWFSMFLGQCLLMLLNVWSVKMLMSILANGQSDVFLRFILAIAFCRVAQKFDTYLQSMGINAAHTGGSLADDLLALGGTLKSTAGGIITGAGNKELGQMVAKNGMAGTLGYGLGKFAGHSPIKNGGDSPKKVGTDLKNTNNSTQATPSDEPTLTYDDNGNPIRNDENENTTTTTAPTSVTDLKEQAKKYQNVFDENGQVKGNQLGKDINNKPILTGTNSQNLANAIVHSSTKEAMNSGAQMGNASEIKANTIMHNTPDTANRIMNANVNGGIQDEAVKTATYQKLFDGDTPSDGGVENVLPGLSEQVQQSSDGFGVENFEMNMNDGEISGTYTPTTTDDEVSLPQEYSIRTAESYERLTNDQKAEYAAFTGSDNRRYYAKSTTAEISNVDVGATPNNTQSSMSNPQRNTNPKHSPKSGKSTK